MLACGLAGALLSGAAVQQRLDARWSGALDGERVLVQGRVDSLPLDRGDGLELDLDGEVTAPATLRRRLRVRVAGAVPGTMPRAGETWRLVLRLGPPRAALNPGGGDPERLLFRERIDALGRIVPSTLAERVAPAGVGWDPLRAAIATRIREGVADRDAAALIAGLAVGATGEMSREQWRVFNATGTVHLVAISGLHVTLFAWLATRAARRAWRYARLGRLCEREPFAAACGLAAALGYALLAGFSVPTQRTLVMLAVWWWARLAGRRAGALEILGLALLAVLAWDPLAPLAAGFWLSFTAIAVLMAGDAGLAPAGRADATDDPAAGSATPRARRWRHVAQATQAAAASLREAARSTALTQWRITLALAPATLLLFASVPLGGLVANALAIPFFSLLLVPLVLGALAVLPCWPALAIAGWQAAERLVVAAWPVLEAMADWPASVVHAEPGALALLAGVAAVPLLLLPASRALRATALVALLPLLGSGEPAPRDGEFRAWLLDAGDGLALVVMTRAHTIVYDTGDVYGSDGTRATQRLLPALRALGRPRVDLLVQSRANGFRVGGVAALLASTPVARLQSGGRWRDGPRPLEPCARDSGWVWDGVEVRVFPASAPGRGAVADEAASCVLRVAAESGRGRALLVPAQVDRAEALALAADGPATRLRADVVLAPRRGSLAPLAAEWVAAVAPRHVLVASRELPAARRARLATAWGLAPGRLHATASDGALRLEVRRRPAPPAIERYVDRLPARAWRVPRDY